ncbi:hypothetical protein Goshw_023972, partial [Gossypium schwendimanii]|nr:hypothetical protein [Gossypium schwendimanii]
MNTSNSLMRFLLEGKQLEKVFNHNTSGIEGKNSDEVLVVGLTFMKKGRSSHGSVEEYHRERTSKSIPSDSEFTLTEAILKLVRSKS